MSMRAAAMAASLFLASSSSLLAQPGNLVGNGQFNFGTGTLGWTPSPIGTSLSYEAVTDADACVGSGAAVGVNSNSSDFAGSTFTWTCIDSPQVGQQLTIGGSFLFVSQAVEGHVSAYINFLDSPGCIGNIVGSGVNSGQGVGTLSGWQTKRSSAATVPPEAQSARVTVLLVKTNGGDPSMAVRFDNIQLLPANQIYTEDFEIGATCRWSSAAP